MSAVLVTGVGGGVGQSITKALADSRLSLVGVDADELASGLQAVPVAYRVPRSNQPGYIDSLLKICKLEDCSLVFPGLDPELSQLAEAVDRFRDIGTTVVVSSPEVIRIADDKLATARLLAQAGLAFPETVLLGDDVDPSWLPVVLKPRTGGSRSNGVFVVRTTEELRRAQDVVDPGNCVVQEYLGGDEYTCGTVNFEGVCYGPIVMRRELRGGDTYRAQVVVDERISEYVRAVAQHLGPFGPCNFQLRLRGGAPVLFEINPRCSGTTAARALAGFNEPLMVADYLLSGRPVVYSIQEIMVLRYWAELVASPERLSSLASGRRSVGDPWRL